ncbi:MAG TPA: ABC transporter substrate-binding protein [Methanotrichaceae archaeon]|nr:ABC transporter substrate-binding protein [Methanotrichaceae archaeon]HQF17149.1 ABC transporter substrate-binding protein [Methanotrichaceae archaeon]HQI91549.1 ABC transporter substrate-binding protein [Methanotrichaceae archaeon]
MIRSIPIFLLFVAAAAMLTALSVLASDYTLEIFGNANMDDKIDQGDLRYLEEVIAGTKPATKLSDANYDGKVDSKDLDQTAEIVSGNEKKISIIDSAGRVVSVKMPIERVVAFNNEHVETMRSIKADNKIVGVGTHIKSNELLSEFYDYPSVGATKNPDYENLVELNPDVVLLYATFSTIEAEEIQSRLKDLNPGINVIRIDAFKPESYAKEAITLGYLFDRRSDADEFVNFYESWMNSITNVVDRIPEDERPTVYYENRKPYYSAGNGTGHQQKIELAGGRNIFSDLKGYSDVDPEAVVVRDPELIVRIDADIKGYNATDGRELREIHGDILNRSELVEVRAIKNDRVYVMNNQIVGNVRHFIGIGYLAKWFHPELLKDLNPKATHQEYLTRFQGLPWDFLDNQGVFVCPEHA